MSLIRFIKRKAAKIIPTSTATVKSTSTVKKNAVNKTATSPAGARNRWRNRSTSLIFQATMTSTADNAGKGTRLTTGAKAKIIRNSVIAWIIPAKGVLAPVLILVAVLAIAPVAGMPPKKADPKLAIPCPTSSQLDLCLPPDMPSATIAESNDSMAANRAIVIASGIKCRNVATLKGRSGKEGKGKTLGISPYRSAMVATGKENSQQMRVDKTMAAMPQGIKVKNRRTQIISANVPALTPSVQPSQVGIALKNACHLGIKSAGTFAMCNPKKSFT